MPATGKVDRLGELFEMVGASAFQHVGADLVGELDKIGVERAAQSARQRFACLGRAVELEQRVGERAARHRLAHDETLLGIVRDQPLEMLDRLLATFELGKLGLKLKQLGALERVVAVGEECLGLFECVLGVSRNA